MGSAPGPSRPRSRARSVGRTDQRPRAGRTAPPGARSAVPARANRRRGSAPPDRRRRSAGRRPRRPRPTPGASCTPVTSPPLEPTHWAARAVRSVVTTAAHAAVTRPAVASTAPTSRRPVGGSPGPRRRQPVRAGDGGTERDQFAAADLHGRRHEPVVDRGPSPGTGERDQPQRTTGHEAQQGRRIPAAQRRHTGHDAVPPPDRADRPGDRHGPQDRGGLVPALASSACGSESATTPPPAWT